MGHGLHHQSPPQKVVQRGWPASGTRFPVEGLNCFSAVRTRPRGPVALRVQACLCGSRVRAGCGRLRSPTAAGLSFSRSPHKESESGFPLILQFGAGPECSIASSAKASPAPRSGQPSKGALFGRRRNSKKRAAKDPTTLRNSINPRTESFTSTSKNHSCPPDTGAKRKVLESSCKRSRLHSHVASPQGYWPTGTRSYIVLMMDSLRFLSQRS